MKDALDQFALSVPAPWIKHKDRDFAGDVLLLLSVAVDQFNEAQLALALFKPFTMDDVRRDAEGTPIREDETQSRLRFLYAKAFVYSLDAARAFVRVLSEFSSISATTAGLCQDFQRQFGYIRDIRNSLQHIEERTQAKGSSGRRLTGPILDLGSLNERRFGITSGDGRHMEIEISHLLLQGFRAALLDVMWSFEWLGPGDTQLHRGVDA